MTRLTLLLGTAAMALTLATATTAQDADTATDAPATDAPATEAPPADAPVAPEATSAPAADATTVVASVGDIDITLGEMIIARSQLPQQYSQFPDDVIFQGILDQLVQQQLLANSLTDAPARVGWAMANQERSLRAGEVITALTEEAVSDAAIAAAYEEMTAASAAAPVTEWNARHILVATEEEAQAALARVNGDEDFAAVATEISTDPSGATNGGDLGWFGPGQMVGEFEQAVTDMTPGDVAGPIQTQFGWHIVKLEETRDRPLPTLEEVQPEIISSLQEAVIMSKIEELQAGTAVTLPDAGAFDPALLNNLDLLDQ